MTQLKVLHNTGSIPLLFVIPSRESHHDQICDQISQLPGWSTLSRAQYDQHPDILWCPPPEENLKIAHVRSLLAEQTYAPYQSTQRLFILQHLETASLEAQQALLKALEEPPPYLQWLLTTTSLAVIPQTVLSRCHVQHLDPIATTQAEASQLAQLHQELLTRSWGGLIELAENYKDKDAALSLIDTLTKYLLTLPEYPTPALTLQIRKLQQTHAYILQNVSPYLAVSQAFFAFHK